MNGVGGVGGKNHVSRPDSDQDQVAHTLLDADGDHCFGIRIDIHVVTGPVPGGYGLAQPSDAHGGGVPVIVRLLGRLGHFIHNMLRGWDVGVSHAQVDDVCACLTLRGHLEGAGVSETGLINTKKKNHSQLSMVPVL